MALESKLEAASKEIQQLHRALEKSDAYVDDLNRQINQQRCPNCDRPSRNPSEVMSKAKSAGKSNDALPLVEDFRLDDSDLPSTISAESSRSVLVLNDDNASLSLDLDFGGDNDKLEGSASFNLEAPSSLMTNSTTSGMFRLHGGNCANQKSAIFSDDRSMKYSTNPDMKESTSSSFNLELPSPRGTGYCLLFTRSNLSKY